MIALVDLGYTLRATRFSGRYNRDVTYSFETVEPYYLQTDWDLGGGRRRSRTTWDVVGRVGRYKLDYETIGVARRRAALGFRQPLWRRHRLHAGPVRPAGLRRELHGPAVRSRPSRGTTRAFARALRSLTEPSNDESALSRRHRSGACCRRRQRRKPTTPSATQDVLTITVYDQADLSGKFTVDPDGTLTFPLLGRVKAGGLTLRGLEEDLKKRLADGYLRNPQVSVVDGDVSQPAHLRDGRGAGAWRVSAHRRHDRSSRRSRAQARPRRRPPTRR